MHKGKREHNIGFDMNIDVDEHQTKSVPLGKTCFYVKIHTVSCSPRATT